MGCGGTLYLRRAPIPVRSAFVSTICSILHDLCFYPDDTMVVCNLQSVIWMLMLVLDSFCIPTLPEA